MRSAFGSYLPVIEVLMGVCAIVAIMVFILYRLRLNSAGPEGIKAHSQ
jgi:hypothetical protein